ncbi:translocator protein, LysE family [Bacteriovorax sp. BSW11_IV]|uniref:LysE family translocator n=1 Tax=Bacteriovorax sp. BSW11_IV TaxID=1353529 RepID=UPI00038A4901|nr:LysE family translocator [Bacteriovorax sp. BSW11_IV]EQC48640.1 translocator protein, LysE family [Bacteriovorax sp. BSW11_IV]
MDNTLTPSLLTFTTLCFILAITPGADTALVLKSSLSGQKKILIASILGICSGLFFHALLSSIGISAIISSSQSLFTLMKYIGAGYLIYLGFKGLYEAYRGDHLFDKDSLKINPMNSLKNEFKRGLLTNILNPKVAVFYLTFLPQFTSSNGNIFFQTMGLAIIHIMMSFFWLYFIGVFVAFFKDQLQNKKIRSAIEAISGTALLAFGIKLALSKLNLVN